VISSTYDALNRLSAMTENSRTTNYTYDLNGNVVTKSMPDGSVDTMNYDALNRKTMTATGLPAPAGHLSEIDLTYDLKGNLLTGTENYFTQSLTSRVVTNSYDPIDRLWIESVVQGSGSMSTTYTYDSANNRTGKLIVGGSNAGNTIYTYNNSLNQLTGISGATTASYTYDLNGNRSTSSVKGNTAISGTYAYDFENG